MKKIVPLIAVATIAALLLLVRTSTTLRSTPVVPPTNTSLAETIAQIPGAPLPDIRQIGSPAAVSDRAIAVVREKAAPKQVQEVFPSITTRISNWRAFNPEKLTIAPFPEMPITFDRVAVKEDSSLTGGRYTTWTGRSADMPGASLVTVGTDAGYDAILVVPGNGEIFYHVTGAGDTTKDVVRADVNSADVGCGVGSVTPVPCTSERTAAMFAVNYKNVADTLVLPTAAAAISNAPTADVLFVYDSTMLDNAKKSTAGDPIQFLDGQYKAVTETMNVFLAQSHITSFQWHYSGLLATPAYERTGKLGDDLSAMRGKGTLGTWIAMVSKQYSVDEVVLAAGYSADFGGIANMIHNGISPDCVISGAIGASSGITFMSAEVCAHELGHTLGCDHDRITANATGDSEYCYAWMETLDGNTLINGVPISSKIGTIMSYGNGRIPYFSNPDISIDIYQDLFQPQDAPAPQGSWTNPVYGTHTIGVAVPTKDAENNSKVIQDNGLKIVAVRESLGMPTITKHPASSVSASETGFLMSVTASGGGLEYQWLKDGVAISGANSSSFSKYSASASDNGTYTVTVSNMVGSVTSNNSSITFTATPVVVPPAPPSNNSGGGGGGGSLSIWFVGALSFLAVLRSRRRGNK